MCSNETKTEKAGEEMAHKLKTIRADMLMLQYQLERELIRYVKRYLAQPRTTLITEDEQFKYNEYTLMDEDQFDEFMENVHARQLYDTGVTAEYGDQLLTLSTCEYTYPNGRFVVVAKKA